jgi:hypothetical protein
MFKEGGGYILVGAIVRVYLGVCCIHYYDGHVCTVMSNIGLCVSAKASFIGNICLPELYMWNRSNVFSDWPSVSTCSIANVWSIVPRVCPVSSIC